MKDPIVDALSPDELERHFVPWPADTVAAGRPMARIGWRLQVFFRGPGQPKVRRALLEIVKEYLSLAGPNLKRYQIGPKEVYRRLPSDRSADLTALEAGLTSGSWVCAFTSSLDNADAEPWGLKAFASQVTFRDDELGDLIAYFPLTAFGDDAPSQVRALFRHWCDLVGADQGYAGLGWILPISIGGQSEAVRRMGSLAMRFEGLDIDLPATTGEQGAKGLRCVAWLTAASQRHLQRAGGAEAVARLGGPGITVLDYQGGHLFQAGDAPQIGDSSQSLPLDAYRGIAHALKPARAAYEASIFDAPMDDPAYQSLTPEAAARRFSQRWLERFDRG